MADDAELALCGSLGGDLKAFEHITELPWPEVRAAGFDADLVLTAAAVARVVSGVSEGTANNQSAQRWASFVRRGYLPGIGTPEPIEINFEEAYDTQTADALERLDELGDLIDGSISRQEAEELMAGLGRD